MATWDDVLAIGERLPGTEQSTSYGRPALKVKDKLYTRFLEDGGQITARVTFDERDALVAADPATFIITDHHRPYEWVVINLASVPEMVLEELLTESWRRAMPAKFRKELEAAGQLGLAAD